MSDYNPNSSSRGPRNGNRRHRGGKRRPRGPQSSSSSYTAEPKRGAPQPSGFQKFLSVISFGLLGKAKPGPSKAYASGAPQPIRTPREPSQASSGGSDDYRERGDRGERGDRDRGDRGDREPRREKRGPRPPVSTEVTGDRLYVGNLSYDASESDLFELFNGSGHVKNAEVVVNSRTQRSKGFAFVTMMSMEDAKKAVADLNGKDFMGRPLVVGGAKPLAPRDERDDHGHHDHDHDHNHDHDHGSEGHQHDAPETPSSSQSAVEEEHQTA